MEHEKPESGYLFSTFEIHDVFIEGAASPDVVETDRVSSKLEIEDFHLDDPPQRSRWLNRRNFDLMVLNTYESGTYPSGLGWRV